jgi:tRNA threonylcarbamoyladenosine biosynthesis protein TsaB
VAVAIGEEIRAVAHSGNMHGQAEILLPLVDRAMHQAALTPAALDSIAVTVGPGSFTGIRAGLAAARGIALAAGARLVGVTSFEAVAAGSAQHVPSGDQFLLIALESRREDFYVQLFDALCNAITAPAAVMPAALGDVVVAAIGEAPLLIAGDAARRAALVLSRRADITVVADSALAAVGASRAVLRDLRQGRATDEARPLYLRPLDVKLPAVILMPSPMRK